MSHAWHMWNMRVTCVAFFISFKCVSHACETHVSCMFHMPGIFAAVWYGTVVLGIGMSICRGLVSAQKLLFKWTDSFYILGHWFFGTEKRLVHVLITGDLAPPAFWEGTKKTFSYILSTSCLILMGIFSLCSLPRATRAMTISNKY